MPVAAVETGKASIPPPIDVPIISKIPPMSLEFNTINSPKIIQYGTIKNHNASIPQE
ncbi:hypothetical protein GCM10007966_20690 [Legionella impletisoli]|uniref:Uncharacterized protein n=1 Tax=Legionella impletisoli TaxID=343510 RepID=A0A917JXU6_9GAMM|nr:hypothetical protein GCM10007966_20690 [Legionella impletisoli]